MTEKKRSMWRIPLILLLVLVLLACLFWDTVSVYLMPKAVLNNAITNTISALENRYQNSPLPILMGGIGPEGQSTLHMEVDTENPHLGSIRYNMKVQTQLAPKRILAKGIVTTAGKALDISLYMDENFAALSSDGLLSGDFYGITYDTFSQDIRSSTLLSLLAGENTIAQWEDAVSNLQAQFSQPITMPQWEMQDILNILNGIRLLKAQVSRETVDLTDGPQNCYCIAFRASGSELQAGLDFLKMELPVSIGDDSELIATFYVFDKVLVKCQVDMTGREAAAFSAHFGSNPETDDISFLLSYPQGSHQMTVRTDGITLDGKTLRYSWNEATGALSLTGESAAVAMTLKKTDSGFQLHTDDFEALLALLTEGEDNADSKCTILASNGTDFVTPEYKNFSRWSLEDTLSLFGSLGGLLGLKLPQT